MPYLIIFFLKKLVFTKVFFSENSSPLEVSKIDFAFNKLFFSNKNQ